MGKCKDCKDWTRDADKGWELEGHMLDLGEEETPLSRGYGRCLAAREGAPMMPRYDSGYTGQLLTKGDFGCSEFRSA